MKILFVRPKPHQETIGLQHLMIVEPLELEILATLVKDNHDVKIVDMILEDQPIEYFISSFQPDVFCVTGYITHIPVILDYCSTVKNMDEGTITIVGGVHIELFPEDIDYDQVDFRVVRNATRSFPALMDFLNGSGELPTGVLKKGQPMEKSSLPEFDFFTPIPDRTLTQKYRSQYFYVFHDKVALIKTSFGCPYKCNFCFCRKITDDHYYARPLPEVMAELASITEEEIYIVDDDFLLNPSRIKDFIRLLKQSKLKKKFLVYGRADFIVKHPDLIKDFREVGLRTIIVGLESFEDIELQEFNKKTSKDINVQALKIMNQFGVDCYAAVIVSPSWREADFKRAGDVLLQLNIKFVNLQPLTPLKGIDMHCEEDQLVIKREDYAKWDLAHVAINPEKMSLKDYYNHILKLYERIVLNPRNLFHHLKYPLGMQLKMMRGIRKVHRQYQQKIMELN